MTIQNTWQIFFLCRVRSLNAWQRSLPCGLGTKHTAKLFKISREINSRAQRSIRCEKRAGKQNKKSKIYRAPNGCTWQRLAVRSAALAGQKCGLSLSVCRAYFLCRAFVCWFTVRRSLPCIFRYICRVFFIYRAPRAVLPCILSSPGVFHKDARQTFLCRAHTHGKGVTHGNVLFSRSVWMLNELASSYGDVDQKLAFYFL